jgi:hypothetical protein
MMTPVADDNSNLSRAIPCGCPFRLKRIYTVANAIASTSAFVFPLQRGTEYVLVRSATVWPVQSLTLTTEFAFFRINKLIERGEIFFS